ncbi:hypothetical protein KIPB_006697 [Kipferlia bialata]|uniref:Uncharacterized protein n=1 Tax=Kipferlia bialata TaxID=797122 RepID=A0A9K3CXM9_9EUKA|nr:hypothetical protein KIPB_006697 [Kipferlia bialata]|eukprot:g6697.t1
MSDTEDLEPIPNIGEYSGDRNEYGARHGEGKNTFPNQDLYVGHYENGMRNGLGTYTWAFTGESYSGEYKNGARNGSGTLKYVNSTTFDGSFQEGRRHGNGTMTFPNGDTYTGAWNLGYPHGKGEYKYASCDATLQGEWEWGRIETGAMVHADGSKWVGGFRMNQPFGEGKYVVGYWTQEGEIVEPSPPEVEEEEPEEEEEEEDAEKKEPTIEDQIPKREPLRLMDTVFRPKGGLVYSMPK